MVHKRLVFSIYATMVVSVWWLLAHADSVAGWILALLLVVLALTADYFITEAPEWLSRVVQIWKRVTRHTGSAPHGRPRA